ncbi:unnamed protein product [Linum tenue]|uniref:Hydroxyproline-rich glycoprotein family protein n=1 Tax=Linum tenue TaxID=586396 RepID=A0AAV0I8U2_9ROSI|nr:unnamed protein product [Linum tenue]
MEEDDRPIIGFPLGLVLLLLILLSMSAVFICCLRWDNHRSFRDVPDDDDDEAHDFPPQQKASKNRGESLPVLMPGEQVPRFIAMACPCQPPVLETIQVDFEKPISTFPVPPLF